MTARDSALADARARSRRIYPDSTAFAGAYMKGVRSALAGNDSKACPYRHNDRKTWRQSFRVAWLRGHGSITRVEEEKAW